MSEIKCVDKFGITPGYYREPGDNIIRHGTSFSDIKHHYSVEEMNLIDTAPEVIKALIETMIHWEKNRYFPNGIYHENIRVIEKAYYPLKWEEIKVLTEQ